MRRAESQNLMSSNYGLDSPTPGQSQEFDMTFLENDQGMTDQKPAQMRGQIPSNFQAQDCGFIIDPQFGSDLDFILDPPQTTPDMALLSHQHRSGIFTSTRPVI